MREFVAPWETSKIGSTLDLNCNSEAFALTCPKCTKTVQCVEEQDDKGIAQAYWDTTETQQSLCHGQFSCELYSSKLLEQGNFGLKAAGISCTLKIACFCCPNPRDLVNFQRL